MVLVAYTRAPLHPCSVVILGTIKTLNLQEARELTAGVIGLVFLDFVYLFVLSLILGAVIGLVTAFLLRRFHFEHTAHEVGGLA